MTLGAVLEPLVVVVLLFGATWINRDPAYEVFSSRHNLSWNNSRPQSPYDIEPGWRSRDSLLSPSLRSSHEATWRQRRISILGIEIDATSPNTAVFKDRFLSRLLRKFPFLVQAWYWFLIYWVYQLGRAFTAVTLVEGTVHVARRHALELIQIEQDLHMFWEVDIQAFFLQQPMLMMWTNRIYSFIHIPGTILFLVWLYHYTTTRNRLERHPDEKSAPAVPESPVGPSLFDTRWRTLAVCNLLAFIVFTTWPCMPPRLLSDENVSGPSGAAARSYGFVDTVHGAKGEASVWTQNKFCNQYAAMPSLHFGYSLLVGLTIGLIPILPQHRRAHTLVLPWGIRLRLPSRRRMLYVTVGFLYPFTILVAIVATANHFILDAVAGAMVCGVAWWCNRMLLNLLPLEDYFLWCVKIHKPERHAVDLSVDNMENRGVFDFKR